LQKKRRWTAEEAESLTIKAVPSTCSRLGVIDYNPSKLFVKELKEHFGGVAMFFYNEYESHVIGVALRPSFTASREVSSWHTITWVLIIIYFTEYADGWVRIEEKE